MESLLSSLHKDSIWSNGNPATSPCPGIRRNSTTVLDHEITGSDLSKPQNARPDIKQEMSKPTATMTMTASGLFPQRALYPGSNDQKL